MTPSREEFIHFVTCMQRLNSAWVTLNAINSERDNALVGPAFRFALVEYAMPYNISYGADKKRHKLDESYVPTESLELHRRILDARFLERLEFASIESSFSTRQCGPGRTMN